MMRRYQGRYRVESTRLRGWDYAEPAWYFVTFCTLDRAWTLGKVRNGRVRLSGAGRIVAEEWCRTPRMRPSVALDSWVVMTNHVHGIIRILPQEDVRDDGVPRDAATVETPRRGVSTGAAPARGVGDRAPRRRHGACSPRGA
jgi:putative transposase